MQIPHILNIAIIVQLKRTLVFSRYMCLLVVIGGPTAVGKTATSIQVAQYFKTEIISADSRQFYKEMNVGTAKPSSSVLSAAPHHFVDFLHVWEQYNAGDYERDVLLKLEELFKQHKVILMTGGSGLFIDAVCSGFDEMPDVPREVREKLKDDHQAKGLVYLQEQLKKADPVYYGQVDLNNPQRVIRALEIICTTGKPYSSFRKKEPAPRPFDIIYFGLEMPREELYQQINERVDLMIEEGLVEEVKSLKEYQHYNALQTVGYQELFSYLNNEITLKEAIELIKQNTRRYAKRQLTWFRRNEHTHWHDPKDITSIIYKISSAIDKKNS
jgi:tRNA dimethylallyltransferase